MSRPVDEIPYAPGGAGFGGHNTEFRKDRIGVLERLAEADGDFFRLKLPVPGVNAVIANSPELVQEILVEHGKAFDKSDMVRFALFPLVGEGLFTSNGELWRRQRKLMAPLFQPRVLEQYGRDMTECAHRTVADWRDGDEKALLGETTRLTMSVAGKTLFDADTFSEADAIGHALTVALDWTGWMAGRPFAIVHLLTRRLFESWGWHGAARRLRGPLFHVGRRGRELAEAIRVLDERVQQMIDDRRAATDRPRDLLTSLLEARDEAGAQMDDRQVRDEILTLFVAGHETTATGLAWTLYLLEKNPAWKARVQAEVDAVGGRPTLADLPRLSLCLRAFREALRLYPPVYAFGRDTTEPVEIAGYQLPKRTNVLISPMALHHSARVWPEPEKFDPDRFLPEQEATRSRWAYLPFGAGSRICIGNHFAYMEAQLAIAVILHRYEFELLGDEEPHGSATLRPKHGVRARIRARR
jgi:cytochrome P450